MRIDSNTPTKDDMLIVEANNQKRQEQFDARSVNNDTVKRANEERQLRIDSKTATQDDMLIVEANNQRRQNISDARKNKEQTDAPINADAKRYNIEYDDATLFQICAICGTEGSRKTNCTD
jgi:hypothetical protein